jgi:quercetin dioxygenase-like cupin family protein
VRHHITIALGVFATLAACTKDSPSTANAATSAAVPPAAAASPTDARDDVAWGPAPSVLPAGAEIAVLQGDPSKAAVFTLRLRFPNGYRIAPHTHPTTENVTIINGTFLAGMGTRFTEADLKPYGQNAFASIPANHPHYAMARGVTVVQVHGMGPFQLTYVDSAGKPVTR